MTEDKIKEKQEIDPLTQDPLLNHEYDGIRELDNPLPGWWLFTFYIMISFAAFYLIHYHLMDGTLIYKEYAKDLIDIELKHAENSKKPLPTLEELKAVVSDPQKLEVGKKIYTQNCLSCHGSQGEGGIGANLTDDYWIHGDGGLVAISKVAAEGVSDKGMPSWRAVLKHEDLLAVSSYVRKLRGTNPSKPKASQGVLQKEVE